MMSADALSKGLEAAINGRYDEAMEIVPSVGEGYVQSCAISLMKVASKKYEEALLCARDASKFSNGRTIHLACELMAHCGLGHQDEARSTLEEWRKVYPDDPLSSGKLSLTTENEVDGNLHSHEIDWDTIVSGGLPEDLEHVVRNLLMNLRDSEGQTSVINFSEIKPGNREESNCLKVQGNNEYKAKKFDEALELYMRAVAADPTNVDVYNNISAVHFQKGSYDECITECLKTVKIANHLSSEYRVKARAYARMGKSYMKLNRYNDAISAFNKSLAEDRTRDVIDALCDAKKLKEEFEKQSYLNPELSESHRAKGNACFREGLYREAIPHYTEAIKRDFNDPRAYSNRAACYIKLMAWREAEKDCDAALELDPDFPRALIRKAQVLSAKKEYMKAFDLLVKVNAADKDGVYTSEVTPILDSVHKALMEVQNSGRDGESVKKALQNPEIQKIISDPVMQTVLRQISEDRNAFEVHMKDPKIAENIRTLIGAGVIQVSH